MSPFPSVKHRPSPEENINVIYLMLFCGAKQRKKSPIMSTKCRCQKRRYRHRVKCHEYQKEMNSDYQETHIQNIYHGKKVKFSFSMESSQSKLASFFVSKENAINKSDPADSGVDSVITISHQLSADCNSSATESE